MEENSPSVKATVAGRSAGYFFLFFLVMFVLKVLGSLTWSWWWVTSPLWGPFAVTAGLFILYFLIKLFIYGLGLFIRWIKK